MVAAAVWAAVGLYGCGTTKGAGLEEESPHWVELGSADGARAGTAAAWQWWNGLVEAYDPAFAREIARPNPLIQPAEAVFTERKIESAGENKALVEEEVWLLKGARLAPYGTKGFAESLTVRHKAEEPRAEILGQTPPRAYREAYARAWAAEYARALHEREEALDHWLERRYSVYRADVLMARGDVQPVQVVRERLTPTASANRRAGRSEMWTLSGGEFHSRNGKDD